MAIILPSNHIQLLISSYLFKGIKLYTSSKLLFFFLNLFAVSEDIIWLALLAPESPIHGDRAFILPGPPPQDIICSSVTFHDRVHLEGGAGTLSPVWLPGEWKQCKHSQQFTAHWCLILMNLNWYFLLMADLSVQFGLFTGTSMHTYHFKWGLRWCELHTSIVTDPQQVLRQRSPLNYMTFTLDLIWILLKIQHFHLSCLMLGRPGLFSSLKAIFINSILSCNGMKYCEQYKRKFFPGFSFALKGYLLQQIMWHTWSKEIGFWYWGYKKNSSFSVYNTFYGEFHLSTPCQIQDFLCYEKVLPYSSSFYTPH